METEKLYYQVMEWDAKDGECRKVALFESKEAAFSVKDRCEMDALIDARRDNRPNHLYYFVSILAADVVRAMKWKEYNQKLNEAREFFMSQYDGEFMPNCRQLVQKLAWVLEICTPTELSDIERKEGRIRIPEKSIDSWTAAWLEAKSGDDGSVWLYSLIKRGSDDTRKAIVNEFVNWESLRKWLKDVDQAATACEQKLIDSCIDAFQWMLNMPDDYD